MRNFKNTYSIAKIWIWIIIVSFIFSGCAAECSTAGSLKVTFDFLTLARNFLDASIVMFQSDYKNQGLARLYYMFFSIQTINIFRKKRNTVIKGEKKHVKAWSGSNAKKILEKSFGKPGFLTIRQQCDYTNIDKETLDKHMIFWFESTDKAFHVLMDETSKSINVLTSCSIPNCDCQKQYKERIEDCKMNLKLLKDDYLEFHEKCKKHYNNVSQQ